LYFFIRSDFFSIGLAGSSFNLQMSLDLIKM
jgi:hypothetical protein